MKKTENRRRQPAVWVYEGTRTPNVLSKLLVKLIASAKKNGMTDEQSFETFANNPDVLEEIQNHPQESVRSWSHEKIVEKSKGRFKSQMKRMLKDKTIPVENVEDFPDTFPKSLLQKGAKVKQNPLWDMWVEFTEESV